MSALVREGAAPAPSGDRDIRWLVVTAERVRPYLYGHSILVVTANHGFGDVNLIMIHGDPGDDNADYLADYQMGRLQSGLYSTSTFSTFAEAHAAADLALGVLMERALR